METDQSNEGALNRENAPSSTGGAEQQVSTPAAPVIPEYKYHINKVYRVVPNTEGIEKKVVLLTFDDGPKEKAMLEGMLDTLEKHEAKAIFFVNGYRVKSNPDLLKLIHDRGQIIGNHSWDHIDLKKESADTARKQVEDVQQIVEEIIGESPRFFRPPFGSGNDTLHGIVEENDMIYMTWSNGSLDWDTKFKNKPDGIIKNVMEQLHPGSNILMHELPWTAEALDELLTRIKAEGYGFVDPHTISVQSEHSADSK
ncbi:polysaccharide deacetylase family protein [Paenibacillus lentus]|uniref:Polysaccharide deacetylase family protein n=1 Tax=Paenibacillus lentus TaxID=1338368 RepID=A0A3S8S1D1_9BACL|nr:polysaccharide deacetylase family protein [Paenibacillus lentus]